MPGVGAGVGVVQPYRGPIDPHTGLPVRKQTQADWDTYARNQQLDRERNQFITSTMGQNRPSYAMSWTDPRTGLAMNYDPGSGGGSRGSRGAGSGDGMGNVDVGSLWGKTSMITAPQVPLPPRVNPISMADTTAAENAEFSKAKDKVGKVGRASLNALSEEMAGRGISGSGIEAGEVGNIINESRGALGDVANNQAINNLKRRYQIADTNYQGEINQRGQDIGAGESGASRSMQALQMRSSLLQNLMSLAARNAGRVY